jgi:PrgI family protein
MPSYQIPQFLDSGEKIFLNLNVRQFAYALAGGAICTGIYAFVQYLIPTIGPYAVIPAVFPFGFIFAYLAIGKFNGRDSEVYVFKAIIYYTKPRIMKFQKQPEYSDLDARMNEWTYDKVLSRWSGVQSIEADNKANEYNSFDSSDTATKIRQIRSLAQKVNEPSTNVAVTLAQKTAEVEQKKRLAEEIEAKKRQEVKARIAARKANKK